MSHENPQDLAEGLVRIHHVISRGVEVARERSHAYADGEPVDAALATGFGDYLHALASVLHGHHTGEESVAYPALRDRFPDAPWDLLIEEHRNVVSLLEEIAAHAAAVAQAPSPEAWGRLAGALDRLSAVWAPHYRREEEHFTPPEVARLMTADEQAAVVAQLGAHSQQHTGPDYLVLPFLFFNLDGDKRRAMSALFPAVVSEQLVPFAWRDKWSAMKPFLLA